MNKLCALLLLFAFTFSGQTALLLDDDWDDGDRTDTNLPEESGWFGSTAATLSAAPKALTGSVRIGDNISSRLWITHFTAAGSPVELAVGDTIKLTLDLVASNVVASSTTQRGLRFGLFNFSEAGASRVVADGFSTGAGTGAPGTNVTGYMLNMNFQQNLIGSPLQIMKRTIVETNNLMGTTAGGVYTALGSSGGGPAGAGFASGVPYTFELTLQRLDTSVQITTKFSDTNGWSVTHTATDNLSPIFKFDSFAIRPNGAADCAEAFTFTRLKVETIPFEVKITSVRFKDPTILELVWDSLPNKTYEVHGRVGLEPGENWDLLGTVPAQGATASFEDLDAPYFEQRFYRIFQQP